MALTAPAHPATVAASSDVVRASGQLLQQPPDALLRLLRRLGRSRKAWRGTPDRPSSISNPAATVLLWAAGGPPPICSARCEGKDAWQTYYEGVACRET